MRRVLSIIALTIMIPILLFATHSTVYAASTKYVSNLDTVRKSGVYYYSNYNYYDKAVVTHTNAVRETNTGLWTDWHSTIKGYASTNGSGTISGSPLMTIKLPKYGYTVENKEFDMIITITSVTMGGGDWWVEGEDNWFLEIAKNRKSSAPDSTPNSWICLDAPGSWRSEVKFSIKLVYAGTNTAVPDTIRGVDTRFLFEFNDVDADNGISVNGQSVHSDDWKEQIWKANSNFHDETYLVTNSYVEVTNNNTRYRCTRGTADEYDPHSAVIFHGKNNAGFVWRGTGCGTVLGISGKVKKYPDWPNPEKAPATQDKEKGATCQKFTISQWLPAIGPDNQPTSIVMTDTFDAALDPSAATGKVYNGNTDVTSEWTFNVSGQTAKFTAKAAARKHGGSAEGDLKFEISGVKVRSNANLSDTSKYPLTSDHHYSIIKNKASIAITEDSTTDTHTTNEVNIRVPRYAKVVYNYTGSHHPSPEPALPQETATLYLEDPYNAKPGVEDTTGKYDFLGWYTTSACTTKWTNGTKLSQETTNLWGKWEPIYGDISVAKVSATPSVSNSNAKYSLAGAQYGVYASQADANANRNVLRTITTDAEGKGKTPKDLMMDDYWVKEISPSPGFATDPTVYKVTLVKTATSQIVNGTTVPEDPQYYDFEFTKVDSITGNSTVSNTGTLQGAEYTLKFYPGQTSASGTPKTWVLATNASGKLTLDSTKISGDEFYMINNKKVLPLGYLTVQESKASSLYDPDPTVYDFTLGGGDTTKALQNKISGNSKEVPWMGNYKLTKVAYSALKDKDGNPQPIVDIPLPGVQFQIINDNSKPVISPQTKQMIEPGKIVCTITTDASGVASTNQASANGWSIPEGWPAALPAGAYKVHEVVPDSVRTWLRENHGYNMLLVPDWTFTITEKNQMVVYDGKVQNPIPHTPLTIIKRDSETGEQVPLQCSFKLYDIAGNLVEYKGQNVWTTTADGKITLPFLLNKASYRVVEETAPNGYVKGEDDSAKFDVTALIDWNNTSNYVVINYKDLPQKANVTIKKTDSKSGRPVAATTYEIHAAEDIVTAPGLTPKFRAGNLVQRATTDANGVASFHDLYLGSYYYVEVETADLFVLNKAQVPFSLNYRGETVALYDFEEMPTSDDPTTLVVDKTLHDIDGKNPDHKLAGAKFHVWKTDGGTSATYDKTLETNSEGIAIFDYLPQGNYKIQEVEAPEGIMMIEAEPRQFIVNENGEIVYNGKTEGRLTMNFVDENGLKGDKQLISFDRINRKAVYEIKVTNTSNGILLAGNSHVLDTYENLVYVTHSAKIGENTVSVPFADSKFALPRMAPGETVIITVEFNITDPNKEIKNTVVIPDPFDPPHDIGKIRIDDNGEEIRGLVHIGDTLHYRVTFTNTGSEEIPAGRIVNDTAHDGLKLTGCSTADGEAVLDETGKITWTLPAVAVGATKVMNVDALVTDQTVDHVTNRAFDDTHIVVVTDPTPPPPNKIHGNFVTTYKDSEPAPNSVVQPGSQIKYKLFHTNTGDEAAPYTLVRDYIPEYTEYVEGSVSEGGVYVPATSSANGKAYVEWMKYDIQVSETVESSFEVKVAANIPAPYVLFNHALTAAPETDLTPGDPANPEPTDESNEVRHKLDEIPYGPQIEIVKSSVPVNGALVRFGDAIDYTLTVKNTGDMDARNIPVYDEIPQYTEFVSVEDAFSATYDKEQNAVKWFIPDMKVDEVVTLNFRVRVNVKPETRLQIVNQATYDWNKPGLPNGPLGNSTNKVAHRLEPQHIVTGSQVTTYKWSDPEPNTLVKAGQKIQYQLTSINTGAATAKFTLVRDYIPIGVTYVEGSASDGGAYVSEKNSADGRAYVEWLLTDIPSRGQTYRTFEVTVNEKPPAIIPNHALTGPLNEKVTPGDPSNPMPGDKSNEIQHTTNPKVPTSPQIEIIKRSIPVPGTVVEKGCHIEYTLTVKNSGGSDAVDVAVFDQIPEHTTFVSAENKYGVTLVGDNTALGWNIPELKAGESTELKFVVEVLDIMNDTIIANQASYDRNTPGIPEGPLENTSNIVEHPARPRHIITGSQVTTYKGSDPAPNSRVDVGQEITYILTHKNTGATVSKFTLVRDYIPDGVEYIEGSVSDGGVFVPAEKSSTGRAYVEWVKSAIPVCGEATSSFKVKVVEDPPSIIRNHALTGTQDTPLTPGDPNNPEPGLKSNEVRHTTDGTPCGPQIEIVKSSEPVPGTELEINDKVVYHLNVTNSGDVEALDVAVYDEIPSGTELTTFDPAYNATALNGRMAMGWNIPKMEPGETVVLTFEIIANGNIGTTTTLQNQATYEMDHPGIPEGPLENSSNIVEHPFNGIADVLMASGDTTSPSVLLTIIAGCMSLLVVSNIWRNRKRKTT